MQKIHKWFSSLEELHLNTQDPVYKLLQHRGALSTELRKLCRDLTVQVIAQYKTERSWIREVNICGDGAPWIAATVEVPKDTYNKYQIELDELGNKFIGEEFLYKHGFIRSEFKFAIINNLVARRSDFTLHKDSLNLTEIFF